MHSPPGQGAEAAAAATAFAPVIAPPAASGASKLAMQLMHTQTVQ
jgi:hypothetical protein